MKFICLSIFFLCINHPTYAQDTTTYFQVGANLFANQYIFYSDGTFQHYFGTDDGGLAYGKGHFKDKWFRRILFFEAADSIENDRIYYRRIRYETNFKRVLKRRGSKFKSRDYYGTVRKRFVYLEERRNK